LGDAAIDSAVRRLPPEYLTRDGAELAAALKARRDELPAAAGELYRLVAREAELHGTDAAEQVEAVRASDGSVEVSVREPGTALPLYRRRFDPRDTREVRLYLQGGDDRVAVSGAGDDGVL